MRDDGPPVFYVTILIEKFSWKIWKTHLFKRSSQTKHHVDVDTRYRPDVRSIWISVIFLRILVIFLLTSKNYSPKSPKLKRTQAFFFFVLIFVRWKRATSAGKMISLINQNRRVSGFIFLARAASFWSAFSKQFLGFSFLNLTLTIVVKSMYYFMSNHHTDPSII